MSGKVYARRISFLTKLYFNNTWYGRNGERRKIVRLLLGRQNGKCMNCAENLSREKTTVDHIVPLAYGGKHSIDNMQAICLNCHRKKDNFISKKL